MQSNVTNVPHGIMMGGMNAPVGGMGPSVPQHRRFPTSEELKFYERALQALGITTDPVNGVIAFEDLKNIGSQRLIVGKSDYCNELRASAKESEMGLTVGSDDVVKRYIDQYRLEFTIDDVKDVLGTYASYLNQVSSNLLKHSKHMLKIALLIDS